MSGPRLVHGASHHHMATACARVSPSQCLYAVFVAPRFRQAAHLQTRRFQYSAHLAAKTRPPEARPNVWDEEIEADKVQILDPETRQPQPPRSLKRILSTIDRKTHRVICLQNRPTPTTADRPQKQWVPLCKIMSKHDAYAQQKAQLEQAKASRKSALGPVKTLEINWAIDAHDLAHRLGRLRTFLLDGKRVEIVFASKKRGRQALLAECQNAIRRVQAVVDEVKGTKRMKPLQGPIGGVARLLVEGPKTDNTHVAESDQAD